MSIPRQIFRHMLNAYKQGVDFSRVAMLGRQCLLLTTTELKQDMQLCDIPISDAEASKICASGYAEEFFKFLGAKVIDSFDYSDYESPTIVCDLGKTIDEKLYGNYSFVYDGGTIEHVFNAPMAIKNAMNLVESHGCFFVAAPCNNWMGHGFYQFSPALYFSILNNKNGFCLNDMFIHDPSKKCSQSYRVISGEDVFVNSRPTLLVVIAQKIESKKIIDLEVYQDIYLNNLWNQEKTVQYTTKKINFIKRLIPISIKDFIKNLLRSFLGIRQGFPLFYMFPYCSCSYKKVSHFPTFKNSIIKKIESKKSDTLDIN